MKSTSHHETASSVKFLEPSYICFRSAPATNTCHSYRSLPRRQIESVCQVGGSEQKKTPGADGGVSHRAARDATWRRKITLWSCPPSLHSQSGLPDVPSPRKYNKTSAMGRQSCIPYRLPVWVPLPCRRRPNPSTLDRRKLGNGRPHDRGARQPVRQVGRGCYKV